MRDFDFDVIIVGSGPAGASTWLHLHKFDPDLASRTLVVEKEKHPRPKLCGGGVMRAADTMLGHLRIKLDVPAVQIHNVEFHYYDRRFYWRQKNYFRVVRRHEFDTALVDIARQRGMRLHEREAFYAFTCLDEGLLVETEKGSYRTRTLVGADGANSAVRAKMGIRGKRRVSRLLEILTPANHTTDHEFVNNTAVMDFTDIDQGLQGYVWAFPCWEDGVAAMNRGIYDSRFYPRRPRANLKSLFRDKLQAEGAYDPNQSWQGHPEWWFDPRSPCSQPGVLLVGDAAGVDPFAGEGISFALQYGNVAARELIAAFSSQDFSFSRYNARILSDELGKGLKLRRRLAALAYPGWPAFLFNVLARVMERTWS